jgi:AraC family transcriptional regulator
VHLLPLLRDLGRQLDGDVSLDALATRLRASPSHVHRAFRRLTGETPKAYTSRLRLERAAVQLVVDRRSILDIALDHGFASHEVFTRAFLRRFHMSPSAYRARGIGTRTRAILARHAAIVRGVGPCIGLYHHSTAPRRSPVSLAVSRRQLDPRPALVVRKKIARAELAPTLGQVFGTIFAHAQRVGVALAGQPFTRYVDSGVGLVTIEAGLPTATPATGAGEIEAIELPGGPAAVATHRGAYDRLPETHAAIERWIDAEGLERSAPPWEVYVTDPGEVPDPAAWQTEVIYPVKAS